PTQLELLLNGVSPWPDVREAVAAIGAADGGRHGVAAGEQIDRPTLQARIAGIEGAVAVEIVEDFAAKGHELEIAEILRAYVIAAARAHRVGTRRSRSGLHPARLQLFLNCETARPNTGEAIGAVGAADGYTQHFACGIEQVDSPALETRIAG